MTKPTDALEIEGTGLDEVLGRLQAARALVLTRAGLPVAALVEIGTLRRLTEERELLRRLALGELESAAGEGDKLASVLEDCRLLLEEN